MAIATIIQGHSNPAKEALQSLFYGGGRSLAGVAEAGFLLGTLTLTLFFVLTQ